MTSWIDSNGATLVALIIAFVVLVWVLVVVSQIAQGAIVRSTADLGLGSPSSLGSALRAGLRYFWRFLGLWALTAVAAILLALGFAAVVAIGVAVAAVGGPAMTLILILAGVLIAVPLTLVAIVGGLLVSIALGYARRAMVVEDVGIVSAIGRGIVLLRGNLGASLLSWLTSIGVSIGVTIVVVILALIALAVLALPAIIAAALASFTTAVIAYAIAAGVIFLLLAWIVGGAVNALMWSFWTLVYLRLTGRPPVDTAPSPVQPSAPMEPATGA